MTKHVSDLPLRPCVGVMLINAAGLVWIGRRIPKRHDDEMSLVWQMPQGGIDDGESPKAAAFRELEEETGVRSAKVLGASADWLTYELPQDLLGVALRGKYRGQKQKWYAMRFTGDDAEIDISARNGHEAEFDAWRWAPLAELPGLIVPFKRPVYEQLAIEFARYAVQAG